jgi:hypothetical protein
MAFSSEFELVRIWSITALAFISFICSSTANPEAWRFCADVLCKTSEAILPPPMLQAAAANAWVLMGTTINSNAVLLQSKERVFEELVAMMEQPLTDVKVSAGECIAFLWEKGAAMQEELACAPSESAGFNDVSELLSDDPEMISNALRLLTETARESSKKVAKKDRKEQRAAFRQLADWILRGESPHEEVRIGGAVIEAETFARIRILEMLRTILIDAFHSSLRAFPVLR